MLKSFFDPESHDIRSAGIRLVTPDGANLHLFFAHGFKLADESALHLALGCKGSGGIKICFLCQNIFNWRYRDRQIVENDATGWAQYHTCCDTNKLVLQTPASNAAIVTRLETAKATLSAPDFKELQTRLGWTYVKGSPLLDPHLKEIANPAKHAMYDTTHVYFVGGVFNIHTGQLMARLSEHGITYAKLQAYVEVWNWPKHVGTNTGITACDKKRSKASMTEASFRCNVSEGRSLWPVFACWAENVLKKHEDAEVRELADCRSVEIDRADGSQNSAANTSP